MHEYIKEKHEEKNVSLSLSEMEATYLFNVLSFTDLIFGSLRGLVQDSDFDLNVLYYASISDSAKRDIIKALDVAIPI